MNRKPKSPPDLALGKSGKTRNSQIAPGTHLRYVVLHHTGVVPEHYDLLVEPASGVGGGLLPTWRMESPPASWTPATPAGRQADHRPIYMEYEGEISGNRGRVRRVATGTGVVVEVAGGACCLELQGGLECSVRLPI